MYSVSCNEYLPPPKGGGNLLIEYRDTDKQLKWICKPHDEDLREQNRSNSTTSFENILDSITHQFTPIKATFVFKRMDRYIHEYFFRGAGGNVNESDTQMPSYIEWRCGGTKATPAVRS
jgi:hypothetical protein